ncbi:MAG: glycosyltransferase family 2 protein [Raineya sp.]|jgi:glycosyltransferase involved in cell wall biosynthesis|nr:glycosyltransferase family 2 protein [Raineya sp.]
MQISVVVPAYNEAESLPELTNWIAQVMQQHNFSYEVIIIDDGSKDDTWAVVGQISEKNAAVKGLQFNRNYGKSAALHTGFQEAQGEVVITMDADLQDDPEEIPALYQMITQENFDLVSGWKQKRQDPISKTIPTKLYNAVTRWFSGIPLHDFNCGLKAYKLRVVKSIEVYGEMHRYIPVIAKSVGFKKIGEKKVKHHPRKYGVTKFGLERFLFGFLDLLSITFVTKFRKRPMHFFGGLGVLSFFLGMMITLYLIGEKMFHIYQNERFRNITDQPLFYLALVAIIVGVQLFMAGFLGEMIITNSSKTQEYVVSKKIGI